LHQSVLTVSSDGGEESEDSACSFEEDFGRLVV
jgi:hypothetical protein